MWKHEPGTAHTLPHAAQKRRAVVSRVNLSAALGRAFCRTVGTSLEEVTAFHAIFVLPCLDALRIARSSFHDTILDFILNDI